MNQAVVLFWIKRTMQQINITSRVKYKTGYVQPLNILWDCVKLKFCRKITVMFWITFEKIIDICKIDVFSFLIRIQTAIVLQTLVVIGVFDFLAAELLHNILKFIIIFSNYFIGIILFWFDIIRFPPKKYNIWFCTLDSRSSLQHN